jgi:hypothetical protein
MPIETNTRVNQSAAITLLKERLSKFETNEGRLHGLAYKPRPNDVGISTTPKAGTTWVQQICHQIRCAEVQQAETGMDFEEISAVVPWIELAFDQGQDLDADQPPLGHHTLRFFKTHCWYDHCPRFPKAIVVFRDPCDVLLSFYSFFEGWFFEPGSIDLETFAEEFWLARAVPDSTKMQNASYFVHLISWYQRRHDDDPAILILFYEDLVDDLKRQVRRIAKFLSNEHHKFETEQIIQHTVQHSSFSFMKQHEFRFDEKLSKLARNEACGLPRDAGMSKSKLNNGRPGVAASQMSEKLRSKIQDKWNDVVLAATGIATYAELRHKCNR